MRLTQTLFSIHGGREAEGRFARRRFLRLGAIFTLVFGVFSACQTASALENWLTSYDDALAAADRTGRPVLALFTGSDWCPHCKTLENNVFATDMFREWADSNVILLMIDLPQNGISQAVRSERSQVCIKYGVRTFPSVLLLAADGTKLAGQAGYTGQSAEAWLAQMAGHMPAPKVAAVHTQQAVPQHSMPNAVKKADKVHESLDQAVETARGVRRPILLVVARPGDNTAKSHTDSLINDPEFESFARENFVVAQVSPTAPSGSPTAQSLDNLLGGVELPPESVELIVTDDGQTPLFSQSGAQPPARIVSGLRRFLAARQAARIGDSARR
jgi:thiol-disulfide isomerase/thioredoxin